MVVEQRGLGWNFPSGNEDIIYFIYTFYNVTSINAADYAAVRPGMREVLIQAAQSYQQRNEAAFGISIPDAGYTIQNMYANFSADMDVANAGVNYATVNVPFAMGNTYDHGFTRFQGWTFDPAIFRPPFFQGTGFVGVKYLKSPEIAPGVEAGLTLFGTTTNGGGDFNDPRDVTQLYRYISGNVNPALGDGQCSFNPQVDHICFIRQSNAFDMRFFQSSGPLTLAPGGFGSIVVAYLFAAPVATPGCSGDCGDVKPGDPNIIKGMGDPTVLGVGTGPGAYGGNVNLIDSLMGFKGARDLNGDGVLTQDEFLTVPGSLMGKALTAQTVFDNGFLLPFAPDAPDFFLIPGDNQVTVMWRPSPSETGGDPYFNVAKQVLLPDGTANLAYDPNYREFDVEGYRVYRGRVDAPNSLTLLAQFDYGGTQIADFAGQVNPDKLCAPDLNITASCPVAYDPVVPGQARTVSVDVPLVGPLLQVIIPPTSQDRVALANGEALGLKVDTALSAACAPSVCPDLSDNGVPFVYVDATVRNNFRYFYSVTAFDINSIQSGPSSLESPRQTKAVTPRRPATNYDNQGQLTSVEMVGRGTVLDLSRPMPTIDPTTGEFSGQFPPGNSWTLGFGDFVATVLNAPGNFAVRLDSLQLGSPYFDLAHRYFWTATAGTSTASFSTAILQTQEIGVSSASAQFQTVEADPSLASRYGGGSGYFLQGKVLTKLTGSDYAGLYGRGCVNSRAGFTTAGAGNCAYNGSRWFDGPSPAMNENTPDPIAGNTANFSGVGMTNFNNAGSLTGVATIFNMQAYQAVGGAEMRPISGIQAGAHRAADFNVYWGTGGLVDSVIDITHNVVVPYDSILGGTWGILNQVDAQPSGVGISYDRRAELTATDMGCVPPLRTAQTTISCGAAGALYKLKQTAVPGAIAMVTPSLSGSRTMPPRPNAGFIIYIAGEWFTIELQGGALPASGTVWSLRQYIGAISGGNGDGGNYGPYSYSNPEDVLPMTAVGVDLQVSYDVVNQVVAPTDAGLAQVHTVPDPYYVTSNFEQSTDTKIIKFVNLPQDAIIRIYSSSGVLVRLLEHHTTTYGGDEAWDVRNRNNQVVASGVYFYHVEAGNARRVGRFTIVNFAQ